MKNLLLSIIKTFVYGGIIFLGIAQVSTVAWGQMIPGMINCTGKDCQKMMDRQELAEGRKTCSASSTALNSAMGELSEACGGAKKYLNEFKTSVKIPVLGSTINMDECFKTVWACKYCTTHESCKLGGLAGDKFESRDNENEMDDRYDEFLKGMKTCNPIREDWMDDYLKYEKEKKGDIRENKKDLVSIQEKITDIELDLQKEQAKLDDDRISEEKDYKNDMQSFEKRLRAKRDQRKSNISSMVADFQKLNDALNQTQAAYYQQELEYQKYEGEVDKKCFDEASAKILAERARYEELMQKSLLTAGGFNAAVGQYGKSTDQRMANRALAFHKQCLARNQKSMSQSVKQARLVQDGIKQRMTTLQSQMQQQVTLIQEEQTKGATEDMQEAQRELADRMAQAQEEASRRGRKSMELLQKRQSLMNLQQAQANQKKADQLQEQNELNLWRDVLGKQRNYGGRKLPENVEKAKSAFEKVERAAGTAVADCCDVDEAKCRVACNYHKMDGISYGCDGDFLKKKSDEIKARATK